jgi:hypothetical protein
MACGRREITRHEGLGSSTRVRDEALVRACARVCAPHDITLAVTPFTARQYSIMCPMSYTVNPLALQAQCQSAPTPAFRAWHV